jgi:tRNA threonylcarbamoyl adenosine modification protein YeaZ
MTRFLVIDGSFPTATVVASDGERRALRRFGPQSSHAQRMVDACLEVLGELDLAPTALERIGVGQGPGSFTGLRVALATARGFSDGAAVPLVGFSTYAALPIAQGGGRQALVFDARKGLAFFGLRQGEQVVLEARPLPIAEVVAELRPGDVLYGNAPDRYPELLRAEVSRTGGPYGIDIERALSLVKAAVDDGQTVLPTYKEKSAVELKMGSPNIGRALDADDL